MTYTAREVFTYTIGYFLLGLAWAVDGWPGVGVVIAGAVFVNYYPTTRWLQRRKLKARLKDLDRVLNIARAKTAHPAGKGL